MEKVRLKKTKPRFKLSKAERKFYNEIKDKWPYPTLEQAMILYNLGSNPFIALIPKDDK